MKTLKIGISTCPNDTYIFGAAIRNDIHYPFKLVGVMDDVQLLNNQAIKESLDIVKVSFGVYNEIKDNYKILKSGGALGFGCGPLLVAPNSHKTINSIKGGKVAIPGKHTTAFTVFKMFFPELADNVYEVRFDKIMPAVEAGEFDAGLVIHEGRFTYKSYGLHRLADMGELWEERFHKPIPLGFIALHKKYLDMADHINQMIRDSIIFARQHTDKTWEYVKKYAQDMDDNVIGSHISLYVNEYSLDLTNAADAIGQFIGETDSVFC